MGSLCFQVLTSKLAGVPGFLQAQTSLCSLRTSFLPCYQVETWCWLFPMSCLSSIHGREGNARDRERPQETAFSFKPSFTTNKVIYIIKNQNIYDFGSVSELVESGGDLSCGFGLTYINAWLRAVPFVEALS